MSKYTLTIEGDFARYDCNKCPLGILSVSGSVCVMDDRISCPLEEVKQGRWIFRKVIQSEETGLYGFECSGCGEFVYLSDKKQISKFKMCPNCKIEMKGGAE